MYSFRCWYAEITEIDLESSKAGIGTRYPENNEYCAREIRLYREIEPRCFLHATQTGVEAGMEQATSWANAAFLSTNRCVSMSFKAWSMNANFLAWFLGTPCLVTNARWVTASTRAATRASNSLASNGGYRLRTTSSTRGGIRRATWVSKDKINKLIKMTRWWHSMLPHTSTISNGTVLLLTVPAIAVRLAARVWQDRSTAMQGGARPVASSTHLKHKHPILSTSIAWFKDLYWDQISDKI